jgi:type IV pilus assembly protein PilV
MSQPYSLMKSRHLGKSRGTTMMEVLMSIVILTFGLLGMAALQGKSHVAEMESYQRGQALMLMQDMVNRIENNTANIDDYVTTAPLGAGATDASDCTVLALAARDQCEWSKALKGASEKTSTTNKGAMVDGRGCVEATGTTREFQISVVWQGLSQANNPSWVTCGDDQYSDATTRRVITTTILIPDLTAP